MQIWIRRRADPESDGAEGWIWEMREDEYVYCRSVESFASEIEAMESARDIVISVRNVGDVNFVLVVKEDPGHAVL